MNRGRKVKIFRNLLFINILVGLLLSSIHSQTLTLTPNKMMLLTGNFDSLVRSYLKSRYTIIPNKREADGIFTNTIYLQDGFSLELEYPFDPAKKMWQTRAVRKYGAHIAGLVFDVDAPDSLYRECIRNGIACGVVTMSTDSLHTVESFALDSCEPLDIVFQKTSRTIRKDSLAIHKNGIYRLDWILLSAGTRMQHIFRQLFSITQSLALHQGCCDYWRLGPPDDFTFIRFEPIPAIAKDDAYWLSIEAGNYYFAY